MPDMREPNGAIPGSVPILGQTPKAAEVVVLTLMMPSPDGRSLVHASVAVPLSLLRRGALSTIAAAADGQRFQVQLNHGINAVMATYAGLLARGEAEGGLDAP